MEKKRIHTTIDYDLWKMAQLKDVKWNDAVTIGIKALVGINTEKADLKTKRNELRAEIEAVELKLKQLSDIEAIEKEKEKARTVVEF